MQIKRTMTSYKNRIRIEMKRLHLDYNGDPFTIDGKAFLRSLKSERIDSYLRVLNAMEDEVRNIDRDLMKYQDIEEIKLLQTIPGIGLFSALMIYSEIGDIRRFTSSSKLLSEGDFIRRSWKVSETMLKRARERMGTISLITNLRVSGEIVYDMLKSRSDIEQACETFKNTLHADRTYMRDDFQINGYGCSSISLPSLCITACIRC